MSSSTPTKKLKKSHNLQSSKERQKLASTLSNSSPKKMNLLTEFQQSREETAESVINFEFRKKRIRILSNCENVKEESCGVLYWMSRDRRVQDNWAFLFAQKLAIKNRIPLHVCFCLVPSFLQGTMRHYKFMLTGLEFVENECRDLNINFHLLYGEAAKEVPKFVKKHSLGAVVCDFSPLRIKLKWLDIIKESLPDDVPFCQVDAHNVVPVWVTSDKQEYAARTIRPRLNNSLGTFLTEFPPLIKHPYTDNTMASKVEWNDAFKFIKIDKTVGEVDWAKPGYEIGIQQLENFIEKRLHKFGDKRNDPLSDAISNLAPWFNFGQISVQRCILAIKKYKSKYSKSVDIFCEEAIIRRELADNFCFYNEHYDSIKGAPNWAIQTLNDHKKDKREWIYTKDELETSKTHDDLWNSIQLQLVTEGKIHGFLRMYWAKKILEWTKCPEEALEISLYLNDKYSLDGIDPNGYVGCMWSICGVHDQGWKERAIFGKIRYMNYKGCERKFDVKAFIARYGGNTYATKNKK